MMFRGAIAVIVVGEFVGKMRTSIKTPTEKDALAK